MAEAELIQQEPTLRLTLSMSEAQMVYQLTANVVGGDDSYAKVAEEIAGRITRHMYPDGVIRFEECNIIAAKRDEP